MLSIFIGNAEKQLESLTLIPFIKRKHYQLNKFHLIRFYLIVIFLYPEV